MKNKSNLDILNDNVKKTVEKTIDNKAIIVADVIIERLRSSNMLRSEMSYYRKVEVLLSTLSTLKEAVKQKDEEIKELQKYGIPQKSKSIVCYSSASGTAQGDRYLELEEKYRAEKKETERDIKRIENALEKIKEDKYFRIIELKYLKEESSTDEQIAEILEKDRTTIIRNKKRLINKLKVILFPQSIKEIM